MSKIVIIAPSVSGGGGAEKTAVLLSNALCEKGFSVSLCVMSKLEPRYALSENVAYYKLDECIPNRNRGLKNIFRLARLYKYLKNDSPDLLIGYTIQGGIASCILSKMLGIKTIVCERRDPKQFDAVTRFIRDKLYHYATGAVFQTSEAQSYFNKIVSNSVVIPNFLDVATLPDVVEWEERDNRIVTAGRLVPEKDQKTLISAFSRIYPKHRDCKLEIWGEGNLRLELEAQIEKLNLSESVFLMGRSDSVLMQIRQARLFVLSSLYEGYPNALLEAMALGIPVISTDCPCGGPSNMITNGVSGLLVPVGNVEMMAEAMDRILSEPKCAKDFSANALAKRIENSKELIIEKWIQYIESIIWSKNGFGKN